MKTMLTIIFLMALALPQEAFGAPKVVLLHPDLPDTLNTELISQLKLFPDLSGIKTAWFEREAWGGITAHLDLRRNYLKRELERSIPRKQWLAMQKAGAALIASEEVVAPRDLFDDQSFGDEESPNQVKAWPEIPARQRNLPTELQQRSLAQYPSLSGQWLVSGGVGYQHNVSSFSEFFTDMAVFHLGFAHALTSAIIPIGGFTVGMGDLDSEYESLVGDGRGSNYSVMAGLMMRAPLSQRTSVYVSGQSGYFRRSLQWGGIFTDPESGQRVDGYARESGDWGFSFKLGLLKQKSHSRKARFFDFNLGLMWGAADPWQDQGPDRQFSSGGRDTWLMFTFRFWDQI